jgi:hypothetical protein
MGPPTDLQGVLESEIKYVIGHRISHVERVLSFISGPKGVAFSYVTHMLYLIRCRVDLTHRHLLSSEK